jgi:hypothetical protein
MRFFLRHPVMSGIGFELLLFFSGVLFAEAPGVKGAGVLSVVGYLHYPAVIFLDRVLSIDLPPKQFLDLCAVVMVPVWIVLFSVMGVLVGPKDRVDLRERQAEELPASRASSDWRRT